MRQVKYCEVIWSLPWLITSLLTFLFSIGWITIQKDNIPVRSGSVWKSCLRDGIFSFSVFVWNIPVHNRLNMCLFILKNGMHYSRLIFTIRRMGTGTYDFLQQMREYLRRGCGISYCFLECLHVLDVVFCGNRRISLTRQLMIVLGMQERFLC